MSHVFPIVVYHYQKIIRQNKKKEIQAYIT
jgi:hypothetical protein